MRHDPSVFAVTVKVPGANGEAARYFEVYVTRPWAQRHDNGALISCGLTVGEDSLTGEAWKRAQRVFLCREMTAEQYQHSGCQSSCKMRGNAECRW